MTESADDAAHPPAASVEPAAEPVSAEESPQEKPSETSLSRLSDILEQFKAGNDRADTDRVNDRATDGSRLSWESVTDDDEPVAPPTPSTAERPSSFQFDLGSALQRLGDSPADAPTATPPAAAPPAATPPLEQRSEPPLARRTPPATTEAAPAPAPVETPAPAEAPLADLPVRTRGAAGPSVGHDEIPTTAARSAAAQAAAAPAQSSPARPSSEPTPQPTPQESAAPVARPAPMELPEIPKRQPASSASVFDAVAPPPKLPPEPRMTSAPAAAPAPSPTHTPSPSPSNPQQASQPSMFGADPADAFAPTMPAEVLPTLPASVPATSPAMTAPIESAPSTPDLNALRSAQLRAKKNQRKGKVFTRSLLAFVLIAAAAGGALVFGRDYLFGVDWDRSLTPIVDQIQLERGVDFDRPVAFITQPPDVYAETVSGLVLGEGWNDDLPEWRALGLVAGDATAASVGAALATNVPATYDPAAETIYRLEGATDTASLRATLEAAWVDQMGASVAVEAPTDTVQTDAASAETVPAETAPVEAVTTSTDPGLLGTSSVEAIVRRAVDAAALAELTGEAAADVIPGSGLPLPIAYELQAGSELGTALLATADLSAVGREFGDPYPASLVDAFDDEPVRAAPAILRAGDIPADPPLALGVDDWGLVWGARLPSSTVDQMTEAVRSDAYRTFTRGNAVCFVAVFQTSSEPSGTLLFSGLTGWASSSPATAQALATQLDPTRIQLEACDPGADAPVPDGGSVDSLIERQLARLP